MSAIGWMELARLLAAFCVFFVAAPAIVGGGGSWVFRAAAGFVRVSFFLRIAMMFLGIVGANFPGIVIGSWAIWLLAPLIWVHRQRLRAWFLRLLQALESEPALWFRPRLPRISRTAALLCALTAATLLQRAWYPLHNLRFARIETYSRALDLQKFVHGETRVADGAAFILAPLRVFSGLYPDSVIRFSGPLFATLLVLAVAFCAFRFLHSAEAACIAAALMAAIGQPGEISGAGMAAVYWVLAIAFLAPRRV